MQFTKLVLAIAGIFTTAVQAAPTVSTLDTSTAPEDLGFTEGADGVWHRNQTDGSLPKLKAGCRDYWDYENDLSEASPFVSDCWMIYYNIRNDGFWYTKTNHETILNYGTCAYGIETVPKALIVEVDNEDVRTTIREAISRFADSLPGEEAKIGAWGQMKCDVYTVKWSIYHS
ncbi:putative necrosis-inducing factor-domain-containing protein [Triangularia verruculosa]|uniref:Necrosis-inducing factor-domain-containing protein n=1 Tax=Triangularia verruculosa TaxID=2587418 RepID=A0AAN6X8K8_9PEZI|nr:putative necrosis-inducing factor-domain-containing protein [Triangularia verruculosa]